MYTGVPPLSLLVPVTRAANPKSSSFGQNIDVPLVDPVFSSIRMLPGFRSPCTMLRKCRNVSAWHTCSAMCVWAFMPGELGFQPCSLLVMVSLKLLPRMCSSTRRISFSLVSKAAPKKRAMFGWRTRRMIRSSLMSVSLAWNSLLVGPVSHRLIATAPLQKVPDMTVPQPPLPSSQSWWTCSSALLRSHSSFVPSSTSPLTVSGSCRLRFLNSVPVSVVRVVI
mmetsp:Transcript_32655/g.96984  ORF Transcript_32655/g.96984 Transcript_32655/m.96984 type:complete len:223 (+) Transcript_32655:465-1133(+)